MSYSRVVRSRLTYANVMATIAVFLALGGGAYAVNIKLKQNQVKTKNLAPDAVTGDKALESSFGRVPSAGQADSATTASNATTAGNIADGVVTPAKFGAIPAARTHNPTDLACLNGPPIPNATDTVILWFSEQFDTADLHATASCAGLSSTQARLTAPIAGAYQVSAGFIWGASDTGTRFLGLRVNGTRMIAGDRRPFVAGLAEELSVSTLVRLSAGDYVETLVHQDSGGPLSLPPNNNLDRRSHFAMHWIGPATLIGD